MCLFHDKHFKEHSPKLVNWLIYAGVGLLRGYALLRDRIRPEQERGVASALPVRTE
jgi:hypothetical protein